ncbi:hypothetical protein F442_13373 [Phytophthora nicotianae P10297]|uniref:Uncharacterized protein n=2 Tax=Phytophthora nicotianae TaxID=4792 RepID=W2YVV8_PHYNI|nr:hypothetical protein L914_12990 [Phytophthora nicotianae]ETP39148.1 hypothetical protein F442_13373 [Phytophthora nicotianae P10297]
MSALITTPPPAHWYKNPVRKVNWASPQPAGDVVCERADAFEMEYSKGVPEDSVGKS